VPRCSSVRGGSFPFVVGATLAGHAIADIEPAARLLLKIGTASQVVDDIAGAFPGVIDHDKDTLGEIANLRRTVPLVDVPARALTLSRDLLDQINADIYKVALGHAALSYLRELTEYRLAGSLARCEQALNPT
jgi:geranylgeranyl pyrophosphate synthase